MESKSLGLSKLPYEKKGLDNVYDLELYQKLQSGLSLKAACFKIRYQPHPNYDPLIADQCYRESFRRYRFFRQLSQELENRESK